MTKQTPFRYFKTSPQIIHNLTPRRPAGQRDPHRVLAKFFRSVCARSPLGLNQWRLNGSLHLLCCPLRDQRSGTKPRQVHTFQKFASVNASVHNHFPTERHLQDRDTYKLTRAAALAEWRGLLAA